jgi:dipeptidyl aminopeptidase/acylaminoacyl peptidase
VEINPDGSGARQITTIEGGITGYRYSPDIKRIAFTRPVKAKPGVAEKHPDLSHANARIYDDLMFRHWDEWVESFSHIFIAEIERGKLVNIQDIMEGEPWESPVRHSVAWNRLSGRPTEPAWFILPERKKVLNTPSLLTPIFPLQH